MISIKGPDLNELQKISDRFMVEMAKIDGIVDLETSLKEPKPTLGVQINRVLPVILVCQSIKLPMWFAH